MPVSVEASNQSLPLTKAFEIKDKVQSASKTNIALVAQSVLPLMPKETQTTLDSRTFKKLNEGEKLFLYAIKSHTDLSKFSAVDIHKVVEYAVFVCENEQLKAKYKAQIRNLFDRLGELSAQSWDRRRNLADKKTLQRVISPELDALYARLELNPEEASNESFQMSMSIAKAELSTRLGVGVHKTAAGVNGAQIIKSLEGDVVGVFKPERKQSWFDIVGLIKRFFGQARLLCNKSLSQEYAEVAAHKLSKALGFHITPAAQMCKIRNREGAFLAFLKGYKEAKDVIDQLEAKKAYTSNELTLFQKMAAYDFLTGNMDCHDENWFVIMKGDEIAEIRVIDHGNSFIESNPAPMSSIGNQYKWGRLKIAKQQFSDEFIQFIKSMDTKGLDAFIQETRSCFLNTKMEKLMRERFWTLRMGILTGQIKKASDLAKLHTNDDFAKCRNEIISNMSFVESMEEDFLVVDF